MDRDIALQITQKITAINTALQTLVTNTAPTTDAPASLSMGRMESNDEPEPVEPEPETRNKK